MTTFEEQLRQLEDRLRIRPLLSVAIVGRELSPRDRAIVVGHTLRVLSGTFAKEMAWGFQEYVVDLVYRKLLGQRPGTHGLQAVDHEGGDGWCQARTPAAVHRCRIAYGRLRGPSGRGNVKLFLGHDILPGELPVYVLLDRGRIVEMAFADDHGTISPGVGRFPPSPVANLPALRRLSALLNGGEVLDDDVARFFDRD